MAEADSVTLSVTGLAKSFGPTQALRACSLDLLAGEIHTVQGENGSGKSTLVKILAGVHAPDRGQVLVGGLSVPLNSPQAALRAGIATVFQEVLVAAPRSVLENVWLGSDDLFRSRIARTERLNTAEQLLGELLETPPSLSVPVEALSLSDRQACCIVRALVRRPKILILDEATSALDMATRDRLFALLRRLASTGVSALFISHRMDEVQEISDKVTVMRSGESVATLDVNDANPQVLVRLMTGAEKQASWRRTAPADRPVNEAPVLLSMSDVVLRTGARPFSMEIRAGEVVGLAGLEGQGQERLLRVLRGEPAIAGNVAVTDGDGERPLRSARDASRHGIQYVPRERKAESLFGPLSILDNFTLPTLRQDTIAGLISNAKSRARFVEYAKRLGIQYGSPRNPVSTLSGGNQQKVVMARWLAARPRVLLLNDPTRGVDLHTKHDLYALFDRLANEGLAVVMISTEVDEHISLMDRVLVLRNHEVFCELPHHQLSRATLVASFFGQEVEHDAANA